MCCCLLLNVVKVRVECRRKIDKIQKPTSHRNCNQLKQKHNSRIKEPKILILHSFFIFKTYLFISQWFSHCAMESYFCNFSKEVQKKIMKIRFHCIVVQQSHIYDVQLYKIIFTLLICIPTSLVNNGTTNPLYNGIKFS